MATRFKDPSTMTQEELKMEKKRCAEELNFWQGEKAILQSRVTSYKPASVYDSEEELKSDLGFSKNMIYHYQQRLTSCQKREELMEQSTGDQPTADQSTVDQSAINQSTMDQPTVNQSTGDQPTADQSTEDQSTVEKSTVIQPTFQLRMQLACEKAIKEKITVEIRPVRFNYLGLPRSGKTSFRLRMLGVIVDISWYEKTKGRYVQPSTGAAEDGGQMILQIQCSDMGTISPEAWQALADIPQEAAMIGQLLHQAIGAQSTASFPSDSSSTPPPPSSNSPVRPPSPTRSSATPSAATEDSKSAIKDVLSVIDEALKEEDLGKVKYALDDLTLVINTDVGGQAEFLDLQASLIQGPSFNLLFSRLIDQLDRPFDEYYTNEKGESVKKTDSFMTVEEVLFQSLSSIACFSNCFSDKNSDSSTLEDMSQSNVMFIGTHLDLVSDAEFKQVDRLLQEKIRNTEFFSRGIVEFAAENQLMLAVDNMNGGTEEIERIRRVLERVITRCFKKIRIPASWLLLSLKIRSMNVRTMSLRECEELGVNLNIPPEELQHALWFLHHRVGVLLYYSEVEALKDTVICQMQVVFDSATNLIKNTFTFDKAGQAVSERFREKAQFSLKDVNTAMSGHSSELLPPGKLVQLLQYLGILTPIPFAQSSSRSQPTYFMPCVLKSAPASELMLPGQSKYDPAPLMLRYDCGYVPVGMFPSMITHLVSSQQTNHWEMIEEGLRKNRVQFRVGRDHDKITLISHPRFLEVVINRCFEASRKSKLTRLLKKVTPRRVSRNEPAIRPFETSIELLCSRVRGVIKSTLDTVASHMNYNFHMDYKFGFECPLHPGRDHLCVLGDETEKLMLCLKNPRNKESVSMQPQQRVWFAEKTASNGFTVTSRVEEGFALIERQPRAPSTPSLRSLNLLKWQDKHGQEQAFHLVDKVSVKWEGFGILLGVECNLLDALRREKLGDVKECWNRVMEHWRQGGSAQYPPTWEGLYTLLNDMEYSQYAIELKEAKTIPSSIPSFPNPLHTTERNLRPVEPLIKDLLRKGQPPK